MATPDRDRGRKVPARGAWLLRQASVAALLIVAAVVARAEPSPAGLWRAFDEHTGKPTALLRLAVADDVLTGRIETLLDPADNPDDVCTKCNDDRKGQKILGMQILRDMRPAGDYFEGGQILDPGNGKVYRCRIRVVDGGRKLEVRGFIGFALLGRTQTWERVE